MDVNEGNRKFLSPIGLFLSVKFVYDMDLVVTYGA